MLESVGHPHAVNPDRGLRKVAAERDWPVLNFSNAVPLRERISGFRPEPTVTAATVVGAGVAAGLVWYTARRLAARPLSATPGTDLPRPGRRRVAGHADGLLRSTRGRSPISSSGR
jgi:hypothetical protein